MRENGGKGTEQISFQRIGRVKRESGCEGRNQGALLRNALEFIKEMENQGIQLSRQELYKSPDPNQHYVGQSSLLQWALKHGGVTDDMVMAYPDSAFILCGIMEIMSRQHLPLKPLLISPFAVNCLSKIYKTLGMFKSTYERMDAMAQQSVYTPLLSIRDRIDATAQTMYWRQSKEIKPQPLLQFHSRVHRKRAEADTSDFYTDHFQALLNEQLSIEVGWAAPSNVSVNNAESPWKVQATTEMYKRDVIPAIFGPMNPASYIRWKNGSQCYAQVTWRRDQAAYGRKFENIDGPVYIWRLRPGNARPSMRPMHLLPSRLVASMKDLQLTDVQAEAAKKEEQKVVIGNLCQLKQLQHKFVVMILREASFLINLQEATLEELSQLDAIQGAHVYGNLAGPELVVRLKAKYPRISFSTAEQGWDLISFRNMICEYDACVNSLTLSGSSVAAPPALSLDDAEVQQLQEAAHDFFNKTTRERGFGVAI